MARPRKRPHKVSSKYFDNVDPLWVPPNEPAIDARYHLAVNSLADWAGPDWPDNEKTYFFPIRSYLIRCHQRWLEYDWENDRKLVAESRRGQRYQAHLVDATKRFRDELNRSSYKDAYRKLGISVAAQLTPEAQITLTYQEGIEAVERGTEHFADWIDIPERFLCRFGSVEFDLPPRTLPKIETAIALTLADFVTGFRKDGEQDGSLIFPRKPKLSKNLPWKA